MSTPSAPDPVASVNIINLNVTEARASIGERLVRGGGVVAWGAALVVLLASAIHLVWAGLMLVPGLNPENATPVAALFTAIGVSPGDSATHPLTAAWLATVAVVALWGIFQRHNLLAIGALLPQQLLLGVSAWGAVNAIWFSHYADGVIRDRGFIAADQFANIAIWAAHTVTILIVYGLYRRERHPRSSPATTT